MDFKFLGTALYLHNDLLSFCFWNRVQFKGIALGPVRLKALGCAHPRILLCQRDIHLHTVLAAKDLILLLRQIQCDFTACIFVGGPRTV